ncbi:50S ribosomal protein L15 [Candidatus Omnitrophota bacterium]
MKVVDIGAPRGANKRPKRVGCGPGSGHGKTSCRGHKGAGQRSGTATWVGFEGGQMPLIRRLPKRGFRSKFKDPYQVVNVESLNKFEKDSTVGPAEYKKAGLITSDRRPVKILGEGNLAKALTVKAHSASKSAEAKINEAGAKLELIKRP